MPPKESPPEIYYRWHLAKAGILPLSETVKVTERLKAMVKEGRISRELLRLPLHEAMQKLTREDPREIVLSLARNPELREFCRKVLKLEREGKLPDVILALAERVPSIPSNIVAVYEPRTIISELRVVVRTGKKI